jgi:LDH2 family malate/lactate/ureidoglycolate dehydrogenase
MLLDMATTQIPFFDVKNAKANKTPLPGGSALDGQGRPTTDAAEALDDDGVANLLPMGGGFKGYGIMMLIEVLTGSLVGSLLSTQQTRGWNPHEYGCFITAIDISSFTDLDIFKKEVGQMCESIRNMDPAQEERPVSIPGDRGNACMKDARQKGEIQVAPEIFEALTRLAEPPAGHLAGKGQ